MFSNEYGVEAHDSAGRMFSLFADKSLVRFDQQERSYLRASLVGQDDEHALVVLPQESFEAGTRVTIKLSDLQ